MDVSARGGQPEHRRRGAIIPRHATSVGVHPAETELGLGIALARRIAIERRGPELILRHALAMLISDCLCDKLLRRHPFRG